jgi:hypothetical protein
VAIKVTVEVTEDGRSYGAISSPSTSDTATSSPVSMPGRHRSSEFASAPRAAHASADNRRSDQLTA